MTALELTDHTAKMLGYDGAEDLDAGPLLLIRQYLDQAAAQAAQDRSLPLAAQTAILDATGCLPESQLAHSPRQIFYVEAGGAPLPFRRIRLVGAPFIQVPGAAGKEVVVTYGFTPEPMADEDEPPFPAWFHPHLADYAAARMLSQGDGEQQSKARFFLEMWYTALARLSGPEHEAFCWRNLYGQ